MFTFSFIVLGYEVWKLVSHYLRTMEAHEASTKWFGPIGGREPMPESPATQYVGSPPELDIARDLVPDAVYRRRRSSSPSPRSSGASTAPCRAPTGWPWSC